MATVSSMISYSLFDTSDSVSSKGFQNKVSGGLSSHTLYTLVFCISASFSIRSPRRSSRFDGTRRVYLPSSKTNNNSNDSLLLLVFWVIRIGTTAISVSMIKYKGFSAVMCCSSLSSDSTFFLSAQ